MWIYDLKAIIHERLFEERAQGMLEYTIIIAVVAIVSVAVFMSENGQGGRAFESVNGLYDQADNAVDRIEIQNLGND